MFFIWRHRVFQVIFLLLISNITGRDYQASEFESCFMVSAYDSPVCALEKLYSLAVRGRIPNGVIKSYLVTADDVEHEQMQEGHQCCGGQEARADGGARVGKGLCSFKKRGPERLTVKAGFGHTRSLAHPSSTVIVLPRCPSAPLALGTHLFMSKAEIHVICGA